MIDSSVPWSEEGDDNPVDFALSPVEGEPVGRNALHSIYSGDELSNLNATFKCNSRKQFLGAFWHRYQKLQLLHFSFSLPCPNRRFQSSAAMLPMVSDFRPLLWYSFQKFPKICKKNYWTFLGNFIGNFIFVPQAPASRPNQRLVRGSEARAPICRLEGRVAVR